MDSAAFSRSVNTRVMLFAGVLTPAAVAVAWLVYFAIQAGWEILYGAALGGLFALAVHAVEHYLHTARHEVLHGPMTAEKRPEHDTRPRPTNYAAVARAGAIMFTFLGIACEHLAKDLVQEMLRPLLISTISLLPVGMLFASAAERDVAQERNPFERLAMGAMLGAVAAGMVSLVRLLAGLPAEFAGTFGWWALLGIGFSFIAAGRGHSLWRPAGAVFIAIAIMLLFAILKPDSWRIARQPSEPQASRNIIATFLGGFGYVVDKSLLNPDLPSRVWIDAKAQIDAHHAAPAAAEQIAGDEHAGRSEHAPAVSRWGTGLARWCGCKEPIAPTDHSANRTTIAPHEAPSHILVPHTPLVFPTTQPASISSGTRSLAKTILQGTTRPSLHELQLPATRESHSSLLSSEVVAEINKLPKYQFGLNWQGRLNLATQAIEEQYSRQEVLCAELRQGFASGMIRSWLVMMLFAIGLGLAPMVEETLRPPDYPSSRTRRNDRMLAWTLAAIVVGGAMIIRLTAP